MRHIRSLVSLVALVPASAVGMAVGGAASTSCGGATEGRDVDGGLDITPGDDAAANVDSGLPDSTVCEPMAWYGPPPCQTDLDCEQQNGTGWYCNTANTMDDGCSSVPYPVCEPLPSIDAGTFDAGTLDLDAEPLVYYGPSWPACGDGDLNQAGEACDDGNAVPGDGCDRVCTIEPNFACPIPGQLCVSTVLCGDGVRTGNEVCDDGNTASGDGCAADCYGIEPGFVCPTPGAPCTTSTDCGDGIVQSGEQCDDGINDGGYGECHPGCVRSARCGDAVLQFEAGEQCDDGINAGGYGECAPGCVLGPHCGDGIVQSAYEQCDDGNRRSGDGCGFGCLDELLPD